MHAVCRGGPTVFACTGEDRFGAIAVMRRGVVSEVITEVPLTDIHGMWAIHHRWERGGGR